MRDPRNEDEALVVVHGIDDAVVADPDPIVIPPGELDRALRSRLEREPVDRSGDAFAEWAVETAVGASRGQIETDFVRVGRARYRTSSQGTAASRSSRA